MIVILNAHVGTAARFGDLQSLFTGLTAAENGADRMSDIEG